MVGQSCQNFKNLDHKSVYDVLELPSTLHPSQDVVLQSGKYIRRAQNPVCRRGHYIPRSLVSSTPSHLVCLTYSAIQRTYVHCEPKEPDLESTQCP